jgi:hypothetical protein
MTKKKPLPPKIHNPVLKSQDKDKAGKKKEKAAVEENGTMAALVRERLLNW